jgi:membrane protein YqaA with SNARE-associated domain
MDALKLALGLLVTASIGLLFTQSNPPIITLLNDFTLQLIDWANQFGIFGLYLFSALVTTPILPVLSPEFIFPVYMYNGTNAFTILIVSSLGVVTWMFLGYLIGKTYSKKVKVNDKKFRKYLNTYGYVAITAFMVFPILPIPLEIAAGVAALDLRKYLFAVLMGAVIRFAAILGLLGASMQGYAFAARPYGI